MFVIEDEAHAEQSHGFASRAAAVAELRRLADIAWDAAPNACPCTNGRNCGRRYHIVEYDTAWRRLSDDAVLDISAAGTVWRTHAARDVGLA